MNGNVGGKRVRRTMRRAVALLAAMLWVPIASANADYQAGRQAYLRGDVVGAMSALRRGAASSHAPSQTLLAFILDNAGLVEEAAGLYRQAAAQGDADAEAGLAALLVEGRGVARDEREAFVLFSRAAERGHAPSIMAVADTVLRGDPRVVANLSDDAALLALRRAAEADHLPAIDRLVLAYQRGELGAPVDAAEVARWQSRAARLRQRAPSAGAKK